MYTGRTFGLFKTLAWTKQHILIFTVLALLPALAFWFLGWRWLAIPALPVGIIGTAVAFNIGFKNNNSYDRLWEARKIWGGIVNSSRTWGIMTLDYVTDLFTDQQLPSDELKQTRQRMIYRHIAWITALRHQLRQPKPWEHDNSGSLQRWRKVYGMELRERKYKLEDELAPLLSSAELDDTLSRVNRATHLIRLQSKELRLLREKNLVDDFRHMEMQRLLEELYNLQGKSERIKNFPLPRQYATMSLYFLWLFVLLVPPAMLGSMLGFADKVGSWAIWLAVPASVTVSWVFHTMERIGDYSENPFEGTANDVPITALSRTIERDLRDMLDEHDLPESLDNKTQIVT